MSSYDVVIIGSGPSGFTAGIYTSRANLKTLMLAGDKWGGQLMLTTEVENFPGFSNGIMGPALIDEMKKQAEKFGMEMKMIRAEGIRKTDMGFEIDTANGIIETKSVIVATGADARWLEIPGEDALRGRGVSSCATCDAAFFRNKRVMIVGGGDAAMEEALFLTKFASGVIVVHRRDSFRASKIMADRVLAHEKIKVMWDTELVEYKGDKSLEAVVMKTDVKRWNESGDEMKSWVDGGVLSEKDDVVEWTGKVDGVFVAIGHTPNTGFVKDTVVLDVKKYIVPLRNCDENVEVVWFKGSGDKHQLVAKYPSLTSIEGVFVSGDVHDHHYRQAITASGYGCMAAIDCEKWLEEVFGIESNTQQW